MYRVYFLLLTCALGWPENAFGQDGERQDPVTDAMVRLGMVGLTPAVSLSEFGIDSNVFREVDNPKRDFTFTISPQLTAGIRAGRSRTTVIGRTDLLYFRTYSDERSVDGSLSARTELPLNRVMPWAQAGQSNGRARFGYEIDTRARRTTTDWSGGVDFRVGGKTTVTLAGGRSRLTYASGETFRGTSLYAALTHTTDTIRLRYAQAMTVLTTFAAEAEHSRDRFPIATERNADGTRLWAGFDLDRRALITGRVRVGYRRFSGLSTALPSFTGLVASAGIGSLVGPRLLLALDAERDVSYSYEPLYPYFVQTGGSFSLTPRLTRTWDVQARVAGRRLAYRALVGSSAPGRLDRIITLGGGVGYRVGNQMRVGFNVDRERRSSPAQSRDYKGLRMGMAVTYEP